MTHSQITVSVLCPVNQFKPVVWNARCGQLPPRWCIFLTAADFDKQTSRRHPLKQLSPRVSHLGRDFRRAMNAAKGDEAVAVERKLRDGRRAVAWPVGPADFLIDVFGNEHIAGVADVTKHDWR